LYGASLFLIHVSFITTHVKGFMIYVQIQEQEKLELYLKIGFAGFLLTKYSVG
jgi:hypothetical protein